MYIGGNPLFDFFTGESMDRYEYLVKRFPHQPWKNSNELFAAFRSAYPECSIHDEYKLGDGYCDVEYNVAECGYDAGDCL